MLKTLSFLCTCFLLNSHCEADKVSTYTELVSSAWEEFHSLSGDFIPSVSSMFNSEVEATLLPNKVGPGLQ